jgi:hypothetical protein
VYTSNQGVKSVIISRIDPTCGLNYNVVLSNVSYILYSESVPYILLSNLNKKNKESKINMEKILCKLNDEYSYNKNKFKIRKNKCVKKNKFKSEDFLHNGGTQWTEPLEGSWEDARRPTEKEINLLPQQWWGKVRERNWITEKQWPLEVGFEML